MLVCYIGYCLAQPFIACHWLTMASPWTSALSTAKRPFEAECYVNVMCAKLKAGPSFPVWIDQNWQYPLVNVYGKSPFLMGRWTISMAIFKFAKCLKVTMEFEVFLQSRVPMRNYPCFSGHQNIGDSMCYTKAMLMIFMVSMQTKTTKLIAIPNVCRWRIFDGNIGTYSIFVGVSAWF